MFMVVLIWSVTPKSYRELNGREKESWVQNLCSGHHPPPPLYTCFPWFHPSTFPRLPSVYEMTAWGLCTRHHSMHFTLSLILKASLAFVFQFYGGRTETPGLSKLGQGHKVNTLGSRDSNPGLTSKSGPRPFHHPGGAYRGGRTFKILGF